VLATTLAAPPAVGAGFALVERDAAGLGRAYAGQAAITSAASLSANPAALPQPPTLSASLTGLRNHLEATDTSGASAQGGEDALIPAAYGAWKGAGMGLDVPFGLSTSYPSDWSGRGAALDSAITSARVTVGAGVEALPGLRVGASVFAQHFSAELSNVAILAPGRAGRLEVDGADVGLGWGLGALWQPHEDLALGLGYTSPVWHELAGSATLPVALGSRADTRVKLVTPESVRLGLDWQAAERWRVLAGAEWTRWSRLPSLDIGLSSGLTLSEHHAWRDTWRLSLGGEHDRGAWTFRAGLAWDQSPIRHSARRYPRLPDTDRSWLALGLGYRAGPWQLDTGFAHLFFADRDGEHPPLSYSSNTSILSLGITRAW
jgi:long-chain fatty acid transport protein